MQKDIIKELIDEIVKITGDEEVSKKINEIINRTKFPNNYCKKCGERMFFENDEFICPNVCEIEVTIKKGNAVEKKDQLEIATDKFLKTCISAKSLKKNDETQSKPKRKEKVNPIIKNPTGDPSLDGYNWIP